MKCHLTPGKDGRLTVSWVADERYALEKHMFELSRTTDLETHFNRGVHTLEVIAAGIPGHRPLAVLAEIEDKELPDDLYFRDAWEYEA